MKTKIINYLEYNCWFLLTPPNQLPSHSTYHKAHALKHHVLISLLINQKYSNNRHQSPFLPNSIGTSVVQRNGSARQRNGKRAHCSNETLILNKNDAIFTRFSTSGEWTSTTPLTIFSTSYSSADSFSYFSFKFSTISGVTMLSFQEFQSISYKFTQKVKKNHIFSLIPGLGRLRVW